MPDSGGSGSLLPIRVLTRAVVTKRMCRHWTAEVVSSPLVASGMTAISVPLSRMARGGETT